MRSLIIASILFLAACATSSNPELARVERVTQFCDGFTQTLNTLSTMRDLGKLTDEQIERVDTAVNVVEPVCTSGTERVTQDKIDLAFDAVITINSIMEASK